MPWNKKKSYNLLKSDKNKSASGRTYTKKKEMKNVSPSSSSSSANSSTGLISKLPKQTNTKKLHKILWRTDQWKKFFNQWNIVVPQTEFFIPRSCKHYLHFNVKLPYPETEYKNCQIKKRACSKINNKVVDFRQQVFLFYVI